jgi:hypothetical protein
LGGVTYGGIMDEQTTPVEATPSEETTETPTIPEVEVKPTEKTYTEAEVKAAVAEATKGLDRSIRAKQTELEAERGNKADIKAEIAELKEQQALVLKMLQRDPLGDSPKVDVEGELKAIEARTKALKETSAKMSAEKQKTVSTVAEILEDAGFTPESPEVASVLNQIRNGNFLDAIAEANRVAKTGKESKATAEATKKAEAEAKKNDIQNKARVAQSQAASGTGVKSYEQKLKERYPTMYK